MLGRGGAAQHDRVARLQAQRRCVDRHVRSRLVHDRDHAQRHANLAHIEAVGQPAAVDHLADRVGERRDLPDRLRDLRQALLVEPQAVEQRVADLLLAPVLHVALVGREDLLGAVLERSRDGLERSVLDRRVQPRQLARSALGRAADLRD